MIMTDIDYDNDNNNNTQNYTQFYITKITYNHAKILHL